MNEAAKKFIKANYRIGSIEEPGLKILSMVESLGLSPEETIIMFHGLWCSQASAYREVYGNKKADMLSEFTDEMQQEKL